MTEPRPGITYRPNPKTRARLEEFAKRTHHRSLSQAIEHIVLERLDDEDRFTAQRAGSGGECVS